MLGGTVSDFDDFAQSSMQTVLAREADTSTDAVYLTLNAGSVIVEAELYFATADGATFAVSQLLAGIFASPSALENALNMQFERDLVGVTASVQQILVAPEYGGGMAVVVIGAAAGGVVAVLVLVFLRKRSKSRVAVSGIVLPRPTQEQELGPVVTTTAWVVSEARVPMGVPVVPMDAQATEVVPMDAQATEPSSSTKLTLAEMVEQLKHHCGVDGDNFSEVVHKAVEELGIEAEGKSLMELAMLCMRQLGLAS